MKNIQIYKNIEKITRELLKDTQSSSLDKRIQLTIKFKLESIQIELEQPEIKDQPDLKIIKNSINEIKEYFKLGLNDEFLIKIQKIEDNIKQIDNKIFAPKILSTGVSTFPSMIEDNRLYVDKTKDIYEIASQRDCFFISRPRRFGKSLLISTFKSLFEGRKDLFKNFWIDKHGSWEWKKHPVVLLDFNAISHDTSENFETALQTVLDKIARKNDIILENKLLKEKFEELLTSLNEKYDCKVVILVDEYDKPIIDHLGYGKERLEIAKKNREIMKTFFGTLKSNAVMEVLRFLFITGVSKFSRVSIFSDLNNLTDLTMVSLHPTLLGYTKEEVLNYFNDHITKWSKEAGISREEIIHKLLLYYDSYRFSKKEIHVFNPYSIIHALKFCDFGTYWFETGSPDFLIRLLKDQDIYLPQIENIKLGEMAFSTYDLENLYINALLFQTGYLTIKDYKRKQYTLGYPNMEVKTAFTEMLFQELGQQKRENTSMIAELPYFLI